MQPHPPRVPLPLRNCSRSRRSRDATARRGTSSKVGPVATRSRKRRPSRSSDDDDARERPSRPEAAPSRADRSQRSRPVLRALLDLRCAARVRRRHPGSAHAGRPRSHRAQPLRGPPLPGSVARLLRPDDAVGGLDVARVDLRGALHRLGYRDESSRRDRVAGRRALGEGAHRRVPARVRASVARRAGAARRTASSRASRSSRFATSTRPRTRGRPAGARTGRLVFRTAPRAARAGAARRGASRVLIDAVLAVEDQRFEAHPGIDPWRILGAAWANLVAGEVRQGGSTLTQQLVKNFFLTPERSFDRKLKEAAMSLLVEARYEKPAILEAYLNEIYLGQRGPTSIHGVGEASLFYFGKPVRSLRLEDAALLAGLISSPGNYSPFAHPDDARRATGSRAATHARPGPHRRRCPRCRAGSASFDRDAHHRAARDSLLPRRVAQPAPRRLRREGARGRGPPHLLDARPAPAADRDRRRCARVSRIWRRNSRSCADRRRGACRVASSCCGRRRAMCSRWSAGASTASRNSTAACKRVAQRAAPSSPSSTSRASRRSVVRR